jgi:SAM-dependent methyltransferase
MFQTVKLDSRPGRIADLNTFIVERCRNKSVLNIGAAGNMAAYLPDQAELSTHMKVSAVAKEIRAMDIDRDAIDHATRFGVPIEYGDCQDFDLGRRFDVILWLEVIEHLDRPADALNTVMRHLEPGGELIVTTFNATFIGGFVDGLVGGDMGVFYDHVACHMPEHIKALVDRHGHRLVEVYFYTQFNKFTASARIKGNILNAISMVAPRLSNAFLSVIKHRPAG